MSEGQEDLGCGVGQGDAAMESVPGLGGCPRGASWLGQPPPDWCLLVPGFRPQLLGVWRGKGGKAAGDAVDHRLPVAQV